MSSVVTGIIAAGRNRTIDNNAGEACDVVKSVQLALSHLQSPLEQMQSQRNYGSFLSKSHLHGMILLTMLNQNCPKSKRQCFNGAIFYFKIKQGKQLGYV